MFIENQKVGKGVSSPGTTPKRKVLGIRGLAKHDSDLKITLKCPGKAVDGMERKLFYPSDTQKGSSDIPHDCRITWNVG